MTPATDESRTQQFQRVLATLPRAAWLVLRESPGYALMLAVAKILQGLLPLITMWATKLVIDQAVELSDRGAEMAEALDVLAPVLVLYLVLTVTGEVGAAFWGLGGQVMGDRVLGRVNAMLMEKVVRLPDLSPFETPDFHDALRNARDGIGTRPARVVEDGFGLLEATVACGTAAAMVWQVHPGLVPLVVAAALPSMGITFRMFSRMAEVFRGQATDARMLRYLARLVTGDEAAKEVRLYGLGEHLRRRYRDTFESMFSRMRPLIRGFAIKAPAINLVEAGLLAAVYAVIVRQALSGDLTLGELALYGGAVSYLQGNIGQLLRHTTQGYVHGLYLRHFFDFLGRAPSIALAAPDAAVPMPARMEKGIELRNVSFRYPDTEPWVLRGLSLHLRPGQSVALVGENGSGKTTLVKLLTRLFDPTEGQILLDGRDLRHYDLDELRRRTTAIFQDFNRYHATARENVGYGNIARVEDLPAVRQAATQGQAADIIDGLADGYETTLGRRFEGGVDLSGGEWQKVALSRAFMRDAQFLILDEPSAALDVETEHQMYEHFAELTRDRTTLLISHRFTTVRMAQRMVVLDQGRIVEDGTHEQLMGRAGLYAELFTAQAERYRD